MAQPAVSTQNTQYNSNVSIASEPSESGKSLRSVRTGITTTDQQTMQSEAMSILTDFISQARQEDAERRQEEREERRIERDERKAEAEERRCNDDHRDESNRLMFQTMMTTILSQTNPGSAAISRQATSSLDNEAQQSESNKKRNRNNGTARDAIAVNLKSPDRVNNMEVEEEGETDRQQNHDVQDIAAPSLIQ